MDVSTPRRRFLQSLGVGTALSVAGCNGLQSQRDGESGGGDRTAAVAVRPDQETLQQRRQEIVERARSGELGRQEAQRELQSIRSELLANATEAFEGNVSSSEGIAIDNSVQQLGVFLVTGDAGSVLDLLSLDPVGALLPESAFERAQQQGSAGTATGPGAATATDSS